MFVRLLGKNNIQMIREIEKNMTNDYNFSKQNKKEGIYKTVGFIGTGENGTQIGSHF